MSKVSANASRFGISQLVGVPDGTLEASPKPVSSSVRSASVVPAGSAGTVVSEARREFARLEVVLLVVDAELERRVVRGGELQVDLADLEGVVDALRAQADFRRVAAGDVPKIQLAGLVTSKP